LFESMAAAHAELYGAQWAPDVTETDIDWTADFQAPYQFFAPQQALGPHGLSLEMAAFDGSAQLPAVSLDTMSSEGGASVVPSDEEYSAQPRLLPLLVTPQLAAEGKTEPAVPLKHGRDADTEEASTAESAAAAQTHRAKRALTADEWEARRKKHNAMEAARRNLLNESFERLQKMTRESNTDQGSILAATIETLKKYQHRVAELEGERDRKRRQLTAPKPQKAITHLTNATAPPSHLQAFLHSGIAMSVAMMDGTIIDANNEFAELLQSDRKTLTNLSVFTITHPSYTPKAYEMVHNLLTTNTEGAEDHGRLVDCKGNILAVHITAWIVRDAGKPAYLMATIVPLQVVPKPGMATLTDG